MTRATGLVKAAIESTGENKPDQGVHGSSDQYLFAKLDGRVIQEFVRLDDADRPAVVGEEHGAATKHRSVYHIWPDFKVQPLITKSISTVKAEPAHAAFAAYGEEVVWAVLDSGIQSDHPHFLQHGNLEGLAPPLEHFDFTGKGKPCDDEYGHGTHVAGIIAGCGGGEADLHAYRPQRDEHGKVTYDLLKVSKISGMAPKCKLISMRVLDENGDGASANLILALRKIQELNEYGRRIRIHGVNLSVGYPFEPEWFACGKSPVCEEVDRLVRSGVVVVAAAGNTGYGPQWNITGEGTVSLGRSLSINDPGNANLAITVGATHRDMPHLYGVSYFSSKGPTGDGRMKPDLVAPGEKILSCAAGTKRQKAEDKIQGPCHYFEDSGTSMAAPHVSGVIAAFLSIRNEYIGQPEAVKEVFVSTATDLKRERSFQGSGLIDLMRAIQSV
jgi:subtilisin family serine protease